MICRKESSVRLSIALKANLYYRFNNNNNNNNKKVEWVR